MAEEYGKGYGKRPLWQWVVIYLVIGGIIYGAVYYFYIAKRGSGTSGSGGIYNSAPSAPSY